MRWFYVLIIVVIFVHLALLPIHPDQANTGRTLIVAEEAQVPNAVTGILLRNRLYDTLFEVLVFTLAVLGVQQLFTHHETLEDIEHLTEPTMVILARMGGVVAALVFLELAIRGHLAPGGGFAAGVAGGTALCLVTLTSDAHELHARHMRWRLGKIEKIIVLLFMMVAALFLFFPNQALAIPIMNVLIAIKVAIGSWTVVLLFVRYRGLL